MACGIGAKTSIALNPIPRDTGTECEVALEGRVASASQRESAAPNGSGNRLPRATRIRSPAALGLGQIIEASVQPRLNPLPALWWGLASYCCDPSAPSDGEELESPRVGSATDAPNARARRNDDLKRALKMPIPAKRKIIGKEFVEVFLAEAAKLKTAGSESVKWLAQGTIYRDVTESGGAKK
jgi:hypothetical protein